jgi:hypothetical protein
MTNMIGVVAVAMTARNNRRLLRLARKDVGHGERWCEAEVNRIAGEIATNLPMPLCSTADWNLACTLLFRECVDLSGRWGGRQHLLGGKFVVACERSRRRRLADRDPIRNNLAAIDMESDLIAT